MVRRITGLVVAIAFLGAGAAAQQFIDPFNYPNGTTVPGYVEHVGDWQIVNGEIEAQSGISSQTVIHGTIADLDCCVETLCIYNVAVPGLQRTGPIARFSGTGSTAQYWYLKLQDNGTPRDGFDTYFTYHQGTSGGSVITGSISPPTKAARARLQVIDTPLGLRVEVYIDTDLDGKWDVARNVTTPRGLGMTGGVGINGARSVRADDLKYFNATLYLAGPPKVGTSVNLLGRATPNEPYIGAASFGHAGVPISANRAIPIDLDALFVASLNVPTIFANFQGITDNNGDFTMTLNIPNVSALVGLTIWSGAVTATLRGIIDIAPDTEITFTS